MAVADIDPVAAGFEDLLIRDSAAVLEVIVAADTDKTVHFTDGHDGIAAVDEIIIISVGFPEPFQGFRIAMVI
jgi:hypothetical protein